MTEIMPEKPEEPKCDWEKVETAYRAGIQSLREIGNAHGITEGAIRKRAKRDKWDRDLSGKINAKAEALVRKEQVRSKVRAKSAYSETEIIESNARVQADALLSHRADIRESRALMIQLLAELKTETADSELFEQLGELMYAPNDKGIDKLNELYRKVIALPSRIDSAKKLSETLKNLIALERQALGLQPDGGLPGDTVQYGRIEWIVRAHRTVEGT